MQTPNPAPSNSFANGAFNSSITLKSNSPFSRIEICNVCRPLDDGKINKIDGEDVSVMVKGTAALIDPLNRSSKLISPF